MNDQFLLALVAALVLFALVGGGFLAASALSGGGRKQVRRRLSSLVQAQAAQGAGPVDFVRRRELSGLPWLHGLLEGFSGIEGLERRISRAKAPGAPGTYLLASAVLGLVLSQAAWAVSGAAVLALGAGVAGLWLPFGWLSRREKQRMEAFQRQLGEALELMGRALRAGHTFAGAMRMVADEFPDPVAGEFGQTLDEINFGLDAGRALAGLLDRVDCTDLKFFVTALNIQRETGGNLAEIVTGIAALIRERYKLYGRVRVLSSEGRLSAIILIALPFAVAGIIHLLNPTYMTMLASEPIGRILAWGALGLMGLGAVVIRRMVHIKV
jgi:tight adherence protein B